ncbi:uncharacterized protein LOC108910456 [Anoplophora glabripennis]|uniref:uncharacterized protein LOC108910456 n=1 Tax=Anoplophora glabripennis TaxID=217634 RepID=UPI0008737DA1|nr:uncharacterized protein LOC108910456 [Anoplophora glabripennis]
MLCKICIFTILLATFGTWGTWAQLCIPEPVETIELNASTLSWSSSDNCEGTQYMIIIRSAGIIEYEYTVDSLSLDVSFLKLCRRYSFTVTPSADHILGLETSLDSGIALPEDTDIVVQNFTGVQIGEDVLIQWYVDENFTNCITYYHVLSWHEDTDTPDSLYIGQNGYLVEHVAQCMNYRFDITVHYNSVNGTTAQFNYTVPEKTNTPTLVELRQGSSQINTTWSLEKYSLNRCNITALYVNGTHFNQTYEIVDAPERPDVLVSITSLRADTMYYFNVSTENTAGVSPAFLIAVQTLEIDPSVD